MLEPGPTEDFLAAMAAASRRRVAEARASLGETDLRIRAEAMELPPPLKLSADGFDLIAEVKKRSPSAASLVNGSFSPVQQAKSYAEGGAAALSILTEPSRFDGSLRDLNDVVAAVTSIPVMRKDFLVSPYQILEARAAGAGGVLLIAALLDEKELRDMLQLSQQLGMFVLVEAFDADDLDHCIPIMQDGGPAHVGAECRLLIGVNCRNLRSLQVEFDRFARLADSLPPDMPHVAESGIETADEAAAVAQLGYHLVLVGTSLMKADDPVSSARQIIRAGRQVA